MNHKMMGLRRPASMGWTLLLVVTLGGCGSTEFAVNTAKEIFEPGGAPVRGSYKIGKPYSINGTWYHPREQFDYVETGIASWYGPQFDGKRTASGEIFDMNDLTAAHRTLQMPSAVRVTNLENGRSLVVRVNDRGPFARSRIIDLSRRSAQLLGFKQKGTAKVRVEVMAAESRKLAALAKAGAGPVEQTHALSEPLGGAVAATPQVTQEPVQLTSIFIQAGAFLMLDNANQLSSQLAALAPTRVRPTDVRGRTFYRVQLGPVLDVAEADILLAKVADYGYPNARVVVE